jgi:photosystem II stability/assembly factor-like uncharacterized protein
MRSFLGCLLAFLFALSMYGSSWVSIGPDGGRVNALAVDAANPAHLIAGADDGAYETTDGAATWRRIFDLAPAVSRVAIDPTNPSILYAATDRALYRSPDGGATWSKMIDAQFKSISSVELDAAGNVYVGLACGILAFKMAPDGTHDPGVERSTDHGATFQAVGAGLDDLGACIRGVTPDPEAPGVVYAHTWTYVSTEVRENWRSDDGATTFVARQDPNTPGRNLLVHPVTKRRYATRGGGTQSEYGWSTDTFAILVSDDGGANWRSISSTLPSVVASIAIDPAAPDTIYAAAHDGLYRTTNLGASWERVFDQASYSVVRAGSRLYDGTASGVFFSDDGGTTWSRSELRDAGTRVREVAVDPNHPDTICAWIEDEEQPVSFRRSFDSGRTWERLGSPIAFRSGSPCTTGLCSLSRNDRRPKMTIDGGGNFYAILGTSLVRLRAGAAAWDVLPLEDSPTYLAADPGVAGTIYTAGSAIRKSVDGGTTWSDVLTIAGGGALALAVDPSVVFVDSTAGTYRSSDGGATWTVVHPGESCSTPNLIAVSPADPHVVWRLGCRGLERSTNGGASWSFAATGLSDIRGVVPDAGDPSAAVLWSASHGLQRTADGGATWHNLNDGLTTLAIEWAAGTRQAGLLYAGTFRGGAFIRSLQPRRRAAAPR